MNSRKAQETFTWKFTQILYFCRNVHPLFVFSPHDAWKSVLRSPAQHGGRTSPRFCAGERGVRSSTIFCGGTAEPPDLRKQARTILFVDCVLRRLCASAWTSLRLSRLQSWNGGYWLRVIGTRREDRAQD